MTTRIPELQIGGLVLAGGKSTRMGQDKAQLEWAGRTLLDHARALLSAAGARRVWISGDYPETDAIVDKAPGLGPLGGLHSALQVMPDGPLWVVPVDMPRLSVKLLHQLRDAVRAPAVRFDGYPLPMLLNVDDSCRKLLAQMLDDVDAPHSVRALQQRLGAVEIPVAGDDLPCLANCNTPQQWRALAS